MVKRIPRKYQKLLDIERIKRETKNMDKLKVDLKKDPIKGTGLFAKSKIKKDELIAFYKVTAFNYKTYDSPTDNIYTFDIYKKNGDEVKHLIGDIDLNSFPQPIKNIPFWAPFANEPSIHQHSNAEMDLNLDCNYRNRKRVKEGSCMIYKLYATKNIKKGEEIMWYYGKNYIRDYEINPND